MGWLLLITESKVAGHVSHKEKSLFNPFTPELKKYILPTF